MGTFDISNFKNPFEFVDGKAVNPESLSAVGQFVGGAVDAISAGSETSANGINSGIGTTTFGSVANSLGNASLAIPNPYVMLAGLAAKSIGGFVDIIAKPDKGLTADEITQKFQEGVRPTYQLTDEGKENQRFQDTNLFGQGIKKNPLGGPISGFVNMIGGGKRRRESNERLRDAMDMFLGETSSFDDVQDEKSRTDETRRRRYSGRSRVNQANIT